MYTFHFRNTLFLILINIQMRISRSDNSHSNEDNSRFETIIRNEYSDVKFVCDLADVAWWRRPHLLATRNGIVLPRFRSRMGLERHEDGTSTSGISVHILTVRHLLSNDTGIYECETLGAIRQFNLTVTVRLTTVELGAHVISSFDSTIGHSFNSTDIHLSHPPSSSSSNNFHFDSLPSIEGRLRVHEQQLIRLTCFVPRALPAAYLHLNIDGEHRLERNLTIQNDDKTFRSILVTTIRINRHFHKRILHCQATQFLYTTSTPTTIIQQDENKQPPIHRGLSNTLEMDVAFAPTCRHRIQFPPQFFTGTRRPVNLTCHMNDANPSKLNFTWHLPSGHTRLGHYLNATSSFITVTPNQSNDFGRATCRAHNELGLIGECHVNMIMGGVPDPIKSCHYTYVNATLTVNCLAGFHQGDEDFFCYMYKRQDNGSYSEHARLKGNCAFILPDLKPERHHDFRVFTKNKFGDNFDSSYSIQVGKPKVETFADKTRVYWPYMAICIIGAFLASLFIICCCCHQIRKSMYNKRKAKGNFESLTYQNHISHPHANSNGKSSQVHFKQNGNGSAYPVRPYRSKDYLMSSEPSTLHRNHVPVRSMYSTEDESVSTRRSTLKETDLDQLLGSSTGVNGAQSTPSTTATVKALSIGRTRPPFSPYDPQFDDPTIVGAIPLPVQQAPVAMQRRSSFQTATKLNGFDFYTMQEPFYLADRQLLKPHQRSNYSPERDLREREHYREIRREYSPYSKDENLIEMNRRDIIQDNNRHDSLVVENQMLTNVDRLSTSSEGIGIGLGIDHSWRELNAIDEIDYHHRYMDSEGVTDGDKNHQDDNQDNNILIDKRDDDQRSLDRMSDGYRRDDETTFATYDRDEDRYRDDGIYV